MPGLQLASLVPFRPLLVGCLQLHCEAVSLTRGQTRAVVAEKPSASTEGDLQSGHTYCSIVRSGGSEARFLQSDLAQELQARWRGLFWMYSLHWNACEAHLIFKVALAAAVNH
jgi:hypothetical protein